MMKYIKKYKLQILVGIVISFLSASILFSQLININNLCKIKNLSFEVSDSINDASYGDQIRIYEIQSTDGVSLDLNKISEDTDWQYDVDLNTLCYYDSGSRKINIDTQEWFGQYVDGCSIIVLKQPSSGILNIYCDDYLIKTIDLYSENWELETISVQGERNIGLALLLFTVVL